MTWKEPNKLSLSSHFTGVFHSHSISNEIRYIPSEAILDDFQVDSQRPFSHLPHCSSSLQHSPSAKISPSHMNDGELTSMLQRVWLPEVGDTISTNISDSLDFGVMNTGAMFTPNKEKSSLDAKVISSCAVVRGAGFPNVSHVCDADFLERASSFVDSEIQFIGKEAPMSFQEIQEFETAVNSSVKERKG
ncbi:unnamed protein product, partial [Protopolystoma xenopodis]